MSGPRKHSGWLIASVWVTGAMSPEVFNSYIQMCRPPDTKGVLQQRQNGLQAENKYKNYVFLFSNEVSRKCELLCVRSSWQFRAKRLLCLLHATFHVTPNRKPYCCSISLGQPQVTVTGWELPVSQNTSVSYLQLLHSLCWANGTAGEAGGESKSHPANLILGPYHTLSQREQVDLGLQLLEGISRQLALLFGNHTLFLCSLKDNLIKSSFSDQHILVLVSPMFRFPFLSVSFCQKQSPPHIHSLGCLPNYHHSFFLELHSEPPVILHLPACHVWVSTA